MSKKKKRVNSSRKADKNTAKSVFNKVYYIVPIVLAFVVPYLNFYLLQSYINYDIKTIQLKVLNVAFFELFAWFLILVTNRIRVGLLIETAITFVFGITEYFVVQFRTTPILPWDIFSIGTAVNVAGNYEFTLNEDAQITTLCFVISIAVLVGLMFAYHGEKLVKHTKSRVILSTTSFAFLLVFSMTLQSDSVMEWASYYPYQFTPLTMMRKNGIVTTLLYDVKYMFVEKPDGYSEEETQEILEGYEEDIDVSTEDLPNVIAIMNETWSDLSVLGQDFETNEEVMPYISKLMSGAENTISGNCHVSIVGGNTANSEFEFITGDTMRFMPNGSIPYMSYIKEDTPSLASHMSELGYETYFIHPNTSNGWNRLKVYTNFGFDNILLRDLDGNDTITTAIEKKRNYTTDKAVFERIEEIYAEKSSDTPIFTWAVTIQNHGGYTTESDDFVPNISVNDTDSSALNTYLSLMNLTDQAFESLVEYFTDYDKKTIIVMFGDHQPNDNIVNPLYKLNGNSVYDLSTEETELRYITPYVIWANYDIEESTDVDTSANYLSAQVLKAGGIPCSSYQNYLLELSEEIPVLSNASVLDSDGNNIADDSAYQDKLEEYKRLAYYMLFDCKYTH